MRTKMCALPWEYPLKKCLVTLSVAAEKYGVSVRTIRRRIADGTVTGYRIGPRLVRVDLDELASALSVIPATATVWACR